MRDNDINQCFRVVILCRNPNALPLARDIFCPRVVYTRFFIRLFTASLFAHVKEKASEASTKHAGVGPGWGGWEGEAWGSLSARSTI